MPPRQDAPNPANVTSKAIEFSHSLAGAKDSTILIPNESGLPTIAFHLKVPDGGSVVFEAAFGEGEWVPISMRSIAGDQLYNTYSGPPDSFIGSVAGTRLFRIRVDSGGTTPGSVSGALRSDVAVLEGIEFGWPPHARSVATEHHRFRATAPGTDLPVWSAPPNGRIHITDVVGNVWGKSGRLILHDGDATDDERILLDVSLPDPGFHTVLPIHTHSVLPWSATPGESILADVSGQLKVSLVLTGYSDGSE